MRGCTNSTPPGSTRWESDLPDADARIGFHLETACRYEQEIGGGVPAELASRAGRRLEAAARVARGRGDLLGEIGFLDRAVALLGTDQEQGVALLPALVSALSDVGSTERAEELAERAVGTSAALGLAGVGARSAVERERIRLYRHPERFDVASAAGVVKRASETLRGLGDELGLARAAYLMSDLTWLMGDPVASYADAERMLDHARRAGSGFDVATALIFMAWGLVEGPWPAPEAIARCDALAAEAAGQRAAELNLRGCRAVLMAMAGHYEQARSDMADARAGLAELHLGVIAAYLALLDAIAETLAGDPAAAERAVRDAEAIIFDSDDPLVPVVHPRGSRARRPRPASPAGGRRGGRPDRDAAGALRCGMGDQAAHRASAAGGRGRRARTRARGRASGRHRGGRDRTDHLPRQRAPRARGAAVGDRRHGRGVERCASRPGARRGEGEPAAATTRERFSRLLGPHPGVQTQEGVKSSSYI